MAWAEEYGRSCVRDAVHWFQRKFNVELYDTVRAFKAARLLCPASVQSLGVTPENVSQLRAFPFLDEDKIIDDLSAELPRYLAAAEGAVFPGDSLAEKAEKKVKWWKDHAQDLPHWADAARKVMLVQPSSAAAERVFSLLKSTFNDQQASALQDYLETSTMLQYNHRHKLH